MSDYIPPPKSNIPFHFSTGGYSSPDFGNLSLNFSVKQIQSTMSDLKASIQVFDTKQETYTYLKYCERYIIGYTSAGVQIIKGRCYFGGIRDIGGFIRGVSPSSSNLGAEILGKISGVDLPAYINSHPYYGLPAFIRGVIVVGLQGIITGVITTDLGAEVNIIPPQDLPAYIKARLFSDLPGRIHGYQAYDLGAYIDRRYKADLQGIIGVIEKPVFLPARIRGWVREAYKDLPASIQGYVETSLPGFIRGTEYRDLGARLVYIQPVSLPARIHGWEEAYLQGIINGQEWPWNLPATINVTGSYKNLPAHINSLLEAGVFRNLNANIRALQGVNNLPAQLYIYQHRNLSASLNSGTESKNLGAEIYPKIIRLTAILSIVTMEHKNLIGVINAACVKSDYRDLLATISSVYKQDLPAYIKAISPNYQQDLLATIGYSEKYITIDKLPINVNIYGSGYRTEDKIQLIISMLKSGANLSAAIVGELDQRQLSAYILPTGVRSFDFEYWKKRERVHELYHGDSINYKDVDVDFDTIVSDYLYSTAGGVATRTNIEEHWRTRLTSFLSPYDQDKFLKKLHKIRILFDMHAFSSIDEAIKYGIDYVTTDFNANLAASIISIGHKQDLSAYLNPTTITHANNNLTSYISGMFQQEDDEVILNIGDGIQTIDI